MNNAVIAHEFVEFMPDVLVDGVLYISMNFATASHRCCCGCGCEVVTPFSPTDWKLVFDGESVSLDPSIGNWSFECQSHYWITRNRIRSAPRWSTSMIEAGRSHDRITKDDYFRSATPAISGSATEQSGGVKAYTKFSWCAWLRGKWNRKKL